MSQSNLERSKSEPISVVMRLANDTVDFQVFGNDYLICCCLLLQLLIQSCARGGKEDSQGWQKREHWYANVGHVHPRFERRKTYTFTHLSKNIYLRNTSSPPYTSSHDKWKLIGTCDLSTCDLSKRQPQPPAQNTVNYSPQHALHQQPEGDEGDVCVLIIRFTDVCVLLLQEVV